MAATPVKLVIGAAYIQDEFGVGADPEVANRRLDHLQKIGITNLDTAQIYGNNEDLLGNSLGDRKFTIDTKFGAGFAPGTASTENIVTHGTNSGKHLGPVCLKLI